MRNRVFSFGCAVAYACALASAMATAAEQDRINVRMVPAPKASVADQAPTALKGTALFSTEGDPMGISFPMSRADRFPGGVAGVGDPDAMCRADLGAIYCNSLSDAWWQPPGSNPTILVADDVAVAAIAGCELSRYVIKVNGNADGLGTGPYTVTAALYPSCPGTSYAAPIEGTSCFRTQLTPDAATIVCDMPPGTLLQTNDPEPRRLNNLYVGIKFSRLHCAVAVGAPATRGFSADSLDFPGFACIADLGGFEPRSQFDTYGKHASFYFELYTRGNCANPSSDLPTEAFPNYKGSNHAGLSYTPGGSIRFADDISLEATQCAISAIEVAVRGNGVTTIDLRQALNNADPINGGLIPGTRFFVIGAPGLVIGHRDFEPPLQLTTPDLWVGYVTTGSATGPIITGRPAALGTNEDSMWVHNGESWQAGPLPDRRYAATDVTIFCADLPPQGSCCDMILTDDAICVGGSNDGAPCTGSVQCPEGTCVGDSVCRDDLPGMNCATGSISSLWVRNGQCEGICDGGDNDEGVCSRQVDCPGFRCAGGLHVGDPCDPDIPNDCGDGAQCQRADCEGPFIRSCGLSACCTADDNCFDMIEKECFAVDPIEEPRKRMFQLGRFCGLSNQRCPFGACLGREGDCRDEHLLPGCEDPFCCTDVCLEDYFCCNVEWDEWCVNTAIDVCQGAPSNDECENARRVPVPGNVRADVLNGTEAPSDPGFCCHEDDPGDKGLGTVWFKFVGPEPDDPQDETTSVRIETCQTNSANGKDSLLQVFTMTDPDRGVCTDGAPCSVTGQDCADGLECITDDVTACDTLIPIGCNDNNGSGCGSRPNNSRICLPGVIPGQTYYVLLAAKDEANVDLYTLDIVKGCTGDPPIPNDACSDAILLEGGDTEPLVTPFDLSGGLEYAPATFDCLMPPSSLPNMENDIWYDWVAPCDAEATFTTCDPQLASVDQPNTTMILYKGCDCPVPNALAVAASDYCGLACGMSSCIKNYVVTAGQCYKIRLGGHLGGTPAGDLRMSVDCPPCPNGPVTFLDPVSGTVDARQPHSPDNAGVLMGIDSFLVEAPAGAALAGCWELCETASTGTANSIAEIIDNGAGMYTLLLDRPLTPGAVTTITYTGEDGVATRGEFKAHPGNADGNGFTQGADVTAIINVIGGAPGTYGMYSSDIDHSGSVTGADMLRLIDLLNGGDPFQPWGESPLNARPACGVCCP